jgi:hypothetical protein
MDLSDRIVRLLLWAAVAAFVFFLSGAVVGAAPIPVTGTTYQLVRSQTDHDNCVGASLRNLCTAVKEGDRIIALSRDLLWRWGGPFRWHDKVRLVSANPHCSGVYSVEDTLAKRFRRRVDILTPDPAKNTRCQATLELVIYK